VAVFASIKYFANTVVAIAALNYPKNRELICQSDRLLNFLQRKNIKITTKIWIAKN
jgi:hypothetical protein